MDIKRMIENLEVYKETLADRNNSCDDGYWKEEIQKSYVITTKMIRILEDEK